MCVWRACSSEISCSSVYAVRFVLHTKSEEWTDLTRSKVMELYVACINVTKFTFKRSMFFTV